MPRKVLMLGATGGCGSQALVRTLDRGIAVTVIVRSASRLPAAAQGHKLLTVVTVPDGNLAMNDSELAAVLRGCDACISSLGHNLSFKGIYGSPRRLCRDTVRQLCRVAEQLQPPSPIRLIVISTEGVDRLDGADPPRSFSERLILALLWLLLPPHADNMAVVDVLHREARANPCVDFCAVRPSDLIDGEPGAYTVHATLQNGILNAGKTTRANVGQFMAKLVTEAGTWAQWKNGFPQILNA